MTRTARSLATKGALGAALVTTLVLSGCSQTPTETGGFDPDEEIELTIAWWGNDDRAAIMTEVIDQFEEKYPNITVVEQPVGAPDDLFNRLATDFASGTAPDVFALGGAKPQEYGAAGTLLDLSTVSDYLDTSKYEDFTLTNATVDGTLYGLPTGGNAIGVLINTDLFEAAGVDLPDDDWTWDDFADAANAISANSADGVVGLDLRIQDILGTYVAQNDEDGIYNWDGELATSAETIESWFNFEVGLVNDGGLPDPSVIVENQNLTPDQTLFGTGKAAITFSYSNQIGSYAAGTGGANVEILPPPSSTGVSGVAVLPSQFWSIAAESKHPEAAGLLVNWLLNEPEPAKVILSNRGLQFNPDILAVVKPLLAPADAQAAEYLEKVLEIGVVAPPQPAGGSILNELSQRIESDILFGRSTVEAGSQQWIDELTTSLAND
ncbi:ABC transporter substrate-binding protein [Protaetiibacter intestinalis]|uniref:Sugar ABC transporter substrate-binding protein n=1 Tax=Protaetiibacter intestinalis TaxID=2419774 RepID=A0A387BAL2_9MICO|nr:sugar ABC transporter substrate-binding protein [Protaetiibacter intestinalis]AYF97969.1 sugar ABC transporter substrate-binding protein [Protaetiibacter intestinalis]